MKKSMLNKQYYVYIFYYLKISEKKKKIKQEKLP